MDIDTRFECKSESEDEDRQDHDYGETCCFCPQTIALLAQPSNSTPVAIPLVVSTSQLRQTARRSDQMRTRDAE